MRTDVAIDERPGTPGTPRVLFLPGLGARAEGFGKLAEALRTVCRPVLVDYPEGEHARESPAELAARIVAAAGPFDAVVASSYGGLVATELVASGQARGVAYVGSFTRREQLKWRSRAMSVLGWVAVSGLPGRTLASVASARLVLGGDVEKIVPMSRIERLTLRQRVQGLATFQDRPPLVGSKAAFVVIQGGLDVLVPPGIARRVVAELPEGTPLVRIPRAGHVPYYTHVAECVEALGPWLARLPGREVVLGVQAPR